jgi:hypothetical protein
MDPADDGEEIATILDTLSREAGQDQTEHGDASKISAIEMYSG